MSVATVKRGGITRLLNDLSPPHDHPVFGYLLLPADPLLLAITSRVVIGFVQKGNSSPKRSVTFLPFQIPIVLLIIAIKFSPLTCYVWPDAGWWD